MEQYLGYQFQTIFTNVEHKQIHSNKSVSERCQAVSELCVPKLRKIAFNFLQSYGSCKPHQEATEPALQPPPSSLTDLDKHQQENRGRRAFWSKESPVSGEHS